MSYEDFIEGIKPTLDMKMTPISPTTERWNIQAPLPES